MIPCQACHKGLYPLERMTLNNQVFHRTGCAKCATCRVNLTPQNFAKMGEVLYCKTHYMQTFSSTGGRYVAPAPASLAIPEPLSPRSRPLPPVPANQNNMDALRPGSSRLSAFLNQHSTPQQQQPPPPTLASTLLDNKSKTSLKDIRLHPASAAAATGTMTTPQKRTSRLPPPPQSSASRLSQAQKLAPKPFPVASPATVVVATPPPTAIVAPTPPAAQKPQPRAYGGGMSLKERLRAYTLAASTSGRPVSTSSPAAATVTASTPIAQRLQNYRAATAAAAGRTNVPVAVVVASPAHPLSRHTTNHDQENQPENEANAPKECGYEDMLDLCARAKETLERTTVRGIKQEQTRMELEQDLDKWISRLNSSLRAA